MSQLTSDDWAVVQVLKTLGIIEPINPSKLDGGVLLACGDCDRFPEGFDWYRGKLRSEGRTPRLQLIAVNGGPLNLLHFDEKDPIKSDFVQRFLLDQIKEAMALKGLTRIIVKGHSPCGKAQAWGFSFMGTLCNLARAAILLGDKFPDAEVVSHPHLDGKGKKMVTYHFHPNQYLNWFVRRTATF